jgi:hypothetical protein
MQVLISHATEDEPAAAALKDMIVRCSLNRIKVWFSSDRAARGGMPIGGPWFSELNTKLKETEWVVATVTPQSVSSPWLYFECGFVACSRTQSVIPVTLGLPISHVPMPLAAYQMYDATNAASLTTFLQRLLEAGEIPYDDEMMHAVLEHTQRRMVDHQIAAAKLSSSAETSVGGDDIATLKNLIEQRFAELYEIVPTTRKSASSLELTIDISGMVPEAKPLVLNIPSGSTVLDVVNEIYFRISDHVRPFSYLVEWIMYDTKADIALSVPEIAQSVPANLIFSSYRTYEIEKVTGGDGYIRDALRRATTVRRLGP